MSNGLKVGLLVVIAAALALLGWSVTHNQDDGITSRTVETPATMNTEAKAVNNTPSVDRKDEGLTKTASVGRNKTTVKFDKVEHDFGTIKQGDQVECVFKITNTGGEPLIIEDAKGSCGCTVPEYPKDPISPGDTRDIKVKFNSAGKSKNQSKTVTLTMNTDPINSLLTVKSFVEAPAGEESKEKK